MSLGILYGLLASLSMGVSFVFVKRSYDEFPASVAFAFQALFGLLLWIPFALYVGITFNLFIWVLGIALISAFLSEAFSFYVLSKADVGITAAVFATYPIFTILFSVLFLGERLPLNLFFFVFVVIFGIMILSLPDKMNRKANKQKAIFWGLLGASAAGLSDTISKGIIDDTSAATFLFGLALMQVPIAFIFLRSQGEPVSQFIGIFKHINKYMYSIIGALLSVIGLLFLWLTFEVTYASIASPLTGAYPLFTLGLAYLWLKEELSLRDWVGSIIIIVGVLGIGSFI